MISVAEAVAAVSSGFTPLSTERIALAESLGRVLAEDVRACLDSPFADVSAMDGYAVRAADVAQVPITSMRIGESAAGCGFEGTVGQGQCVRIFTGAPVPAGADAIVIQEDTSVEGDAITMTEAAVAGRWVRPRGMDFSQNDVLLTAGKGIEGRPIRVGGAVDGAGGTGRGQTPRAPLGTAGAAVAPAREGGGRQTSQA
ncbi:MAG: hypothetical protein H8E94_07885 [Alphaproteobacteria bacterium]|nr:hypothetical protein [Alphaproteobacteria bacterium]